MKNGKYKMVCCIAMILLFSSGLVAQPTSKKMNEQYRPQIHFSPEAHWMNDPNGMVYSNGIYHLFYQHHPYSSVWGPMHWGHATSPDMMHWKHQPIAIYPDSIGTIFSGSAVVDKNNTSGFGKNGKAPLIAIFTQHNHDREKAGRIDAQNQSIAYSIDEGKTWTMYAGNPVIKNPGIIDFRDPKVMWYEPAKKWIMTLATKDCVTFYSSPDLKSWDKESEFGKEVGAHGGVWECPDLISLDENGKKIWVLFVSINPGGPNKGSATQYFVGDFDGNKFSPFNTVTKWIDYGADNYAGITWSNTGNRKIFLGWMSNWLYANQVPTEKWRNAATIPRELRLKRSENDLYVISAPVQELNSLRFKSTSVNNIAVSGNTNLTKKTGPLKFPCRINLDIEKAKTFSFVLSNDTGEELVIGYDEKENKYFVDRTRSGKTDFQKDFAGRHVAPRFTGKDRMNISLVIDVNSVELFADDGLTVMTELFFPNKPYDQIHIQSAKKMQVKKMEYIPLKSIWK